MHGCRKEEGKRTTEMVCTREYWRPRDEPPGSVGPGGSRRAFLQSVVMPSPVLRASRNWGRRVMSREGFCTLTKASGHAAGQRGGTEQWPGPENSPGWLD